MNSKQHFYNSYTAFLKNKFGGRVQKLSVNAGLTCPNRDGTKGLGGCIFCLNEAFTPSYCDRKKTVSRQLAEGIEFHKNRYRRASQYIAYFQSFSNTYTDLNQLNNLFQEALSVEGIAGISVGTRPDCINEDIAGFLCEFSEKTYIHVELGIESVFNDTLMYLNRGHSIEDTFRAIEILNHYNIPTGGHLILGLPGEDHNRMMETADIISATKLLSLKLHQLQILKGTELERLYLSSVNNMPLFELPEYIELVIDFTERLHPDIYIERFAGEVPPRFLVAPDWGLIRYDQVLQRIHKRFMERNTRQGILFRALK
jgi:uncharacterized protein